MDQKPPVRRNTFVIVAAILFNLLWIALLFLSCQADKAAKPTPTPEAKIEQHPVWIWDGALGLDAAKEKDFQTWRMVDCTPCVTSIIADYSVPLNRPPSTCSITPLI